MFCYFHNKNLILNYLFEYSIIIIKCLIKITIIKIIIDKLKFEIKFIDINLELFNPSSLIPLKDFP